MLATAKAFHELTAGDLMPLDVVRLPQDMSVRDAARLLLRAQIAGAPVVDANGRCVGVLSATDFVRMAAKYGAMPAEGAELPITCSFQEKQIGPNGNEIIVCKLPSAVCPFQRPQTGPDGKERILCSEPHCVPTDWQVVNVEKLPADAVCNYMTADPVTVPADEPIVKLARRMLDAHIHRLIVADTQGKPVGVVSSTDVLAAVAYSDRR
jgi:CBS domain-containing protein